MADDNTLVNYKGRKTGKGVKKCKPINKGDLTPILSLAIEVSGQRMGRPAEYANTRQGLDMFINKTVEYFEYLHMVNSTDADDQDQGKSKLIPDIESWCLYLGITRQTTYNYAARGREWSDTIDFYRNAIAAAKKQLMLSGKIPPVIGVFDLANNHGYHNTSEFHLTAEPPKVEQVGSSEDIEEKTKAAGLIWDIDRQEYVPMSGGGEV